MQIIELLNNILLENDFQTKIKLQREYCDFLEINNIVQYRNMKNDLTFYFNDILLLTLRLKKWIYKAI